MTFNHPKACYSQTWFGINRRISYGNLSAGFLMLRQLGHWVEANCNDDPAIFQSSGFQQQATPVRTSPQPLAGPPSFKVENGPNGGQVIVAANRFPRP
jgi:hypothetical protein